MIAGSIGHSAVGCGGDRVAGAVGSKSARRSRNTCRSSPKHLPVSPTPSMPLRRTVDAAPVLPGRAPCGHRGLGLAALDPDHTDPARVLKSRWRSARPTAAPTWCSSAAAAPPPSVARGRNPPRPPWPGRPAPPGRRTHGQLIPHTGTPRPAPAPAPPPRTPRRWAAAPDKPSSDGQDGPADRGVCPTARACPALGDAGSRSPSSSPNGSAKPSVARPSPLADAATHMGVGRGVGREEHGATLWPRAWHTRRPHLDQRAILAVSRETALPAPARRPASPTAPGAERGTDASPGGAPAKDACTSRTHQARARSSAEPAGLPSPGSGPVPVGTIRTVRRGQQDGHGVARPLPVNDVEHRRPAGQVCVQHPPA